MAKKVLGQAALAATTATDVYTVPSGKSTVVSTLAIANRGSASTTYRIAVRPAGTALADAHYLVYGASIPANSTDMLTIGITLAATDVVTVYATAATVSVSLFGDES